MPKRLETTETLPTILVILGATGDLARRKLIPALWSLHQSQKLPTLFQIVGFSRDELTDEQFREFVREIILETRNQKLLPPQRYPAEAGETSDPEIAEKASNNPSHPQPPLTPPANTADMPYQGEVSSGEFTDRLVFETGLFEDIGSYQKLAKRLGQQDGEWRVCANKLFYLAVPPPFYKTIFTNLAKSGLTEPCSPEEGWTRVIVEKPFGKDLATAQELDEMLGTLFQEEQIYRIDHYLGKETARNILAFRFSNVFLQPAWNNRSIAAVHVHFPEAQDVGERGTFYDGIGALRDVGQNHMLQLLALFLMDNPAAFDAESIRRERTRVLTALEIMDEGDIARQTRRGQYEGYVATPGVEAGSQTETYFRIETRVNLPRWQGVSVFLEHGKALAQSAFEVIVQFRHETPCLCPPGEHYTNELKYRIQPDEGVYMSFWAKKPGADMVIEEKDFSFNYKQAFGDDQFVEAYEKLFLDAIQGDQTLFVSTEEIMASWRFIDPIIRAWQAKVVPLVTYPKGIQPSELAALMNAQAVVLPEKKLGYIGLGKMGSNMAARLVEHSWKVVATDPDPVARSKKQVARAEIVASAAEVVKKLAAPRLVWLMVPHQVVDAVLAEIAPELAAGDTVIDGGNSNYNESVRRAKQLAGVGINFLDVGVSGGPSGARMGACLMIGGAREVYKKQVGLFADLAVAGGYDYMGEAGAGHFVKMVHNGIEYGMMQALGEGFAVMREKKEFSLDPERVARLYNHGSVIESSLVGWLKDAYQKHGSDLEDISGEVAHSGEGQWTVEVARELQVPVPIIEGALQFRQESQGNPSYTGKVVSALRNMFGGHEVKRSNK